MRACLGRLFAWHESLLVTAMLLQFFDSSLVGGYELKITQSLTVKPDERFKIRVRLRPWVDVQELSAVLVGN